MVKVDTTEAILTLRALSLYRSSELEVLREMLECGRLHWTGTEGEPHVLRHINRVKRINEMFRRDFIIVKAYCIDGI